MKISCVFINNLPIYLTANAEDHEQEYVYKLEEINLNDLVEQLYEGRIPKAYLYHPDLRFLRKVFAQHFKVVKAAGGKVINPHGDVLFIFRNGVWDLPKGKIEKGEKKKEAAIREVEEETGVRNLRITKRLETTYHIYKFKGKTVLKVSYWYQMYTDFSGALHPQIEEGITQVSWLNSNQIAINLPHSYANIRRLF